jgi:hypothetical protein
MWIKVQTALYYVGHHSHQIWVARSMGMSQISVSRCIHNVCKSLASKADDYIKFPTTAEEIATIKRGFYERAHFPGVLGCIDCSHIKIKV